MPEIIVLLHMDILKFIFFLSLFCSFISARCICPDTTCGDEGFSIRFPFRLEQQPQDCGYPGFDLRCNDQGKSILNLPFSGNFFVRDINYLTQEILLYDPNDCLPSRLLNLNLSSSPFRVTYYQNYTFLSCSSEFFSSKFTTIDCLSNSTISVLATSSVNLAKAMNMCTVIYTLPVPLSSRDQNAGWFSSDLKGDLLLTWNIPGCEECEANGGVCGYTANSTSKNISCFDRQSTGNHPYSLILNLPSLFTPFHESRFDDFCWHSKFPVHIISNILCDRPSVISLHNININVTYDLSRCCNGIE